MLWRVDEKRECSPVLSGNVLLKPFHITPARVTKSSQATALAWDLLERNGIPRIEADLSDSDSIPTQVTQVVFDKSPPMATWTPDADMAAGRLPTDQVFNVANAGSDISIGKSTEIYGTSIQVESEVLKAICPKGVTPAIWKELMETTIDIVALPGKLYGGKMIMNQRMVHRCSRISLLWLLAI
jgi:hypothetical protein